MTERTAKVNAYAKINLSLDVLGRRFDGYHEVSMVMQLIELHDFVHVSAVPGPAACDVTADDASIPAGKDNLVYRAWEVFTKAGKAAPCRIAVEISKEIPMAAGLAGGSADAAAALLAFNKVTDAGCSLEELLAMGAAVGADVPFVLAGIAAMDPAVRPDVCEEGSLFTCALATGTGTTLTKAAPLAAEILLVKDPVSVSTAEAYTALDDPAWAARIEDRPATNDLLSALDAGVPAAAYDAMANVFEAYTLNAYPVVRETKSRLLSALEDLRAAEPGGPLDSPYIVQMSGTGPTLFALSANGALLDRAAAAMTSDPANERRVIRSRLLSFDR